MCETEFFMEDCGFRLELMNCEKLVSNMDSDIKFRLQVTDPTKLKKSILKDNEACEFDFSLKTDDSMEVTKNMLKQGKSHYSRYFASFKNNKFIAGRLVSKLFFLFFLILLVSHRQQFQYSFSLFQLETKTTFYKQ